MEQLTVNRRRGAEIPHSDAPPGHCRWCGEALGILTKAGTVNRVIRWHARCIETYRMSWPGAVRQAVQRRDHGICRACGLDCDALRKLISNIYDWHKRNRIRLNLGLELNDRDLWDADHITPLADGGSLEMANLQTLCVWCHRRKTAEEATKRAERRRVQG